MTLLVMTLVIIIAELVLTFGLIRCSGGNLSNWLKSAERKPWELQGIARQLLYALLYVHDRGVTHRVSAITTAYYFFFSSCRTLSCSGLPCGAFFNLFCSAILSPIAGCFCFSPPYCAAIPPSPIISLNTPHLTSPHQTGYQALQCANA